jgi:hypothetical protein
MLRILFLFTFAGLTFATDSRVHAGRVPSQKVLATRVHGVRVDLRVPYLTNGYSNLGVYHGVAPRIYYAPIIDYPDHPQTKPVYNLPFYGAVRALSGYSDGATMRLPGTIMPWRTPLRIHMVTPIR